MILLFANFSTAQHNSYSSLWKQVEAMEIKGLPKSALKIVKQIETIAKKDNNTPQQIKVMLFKSKFALLLEEDAQLKIIYDFKTEIEQSSFPKKNILESILAKLYWDYFQQNRWKFYNRTKTATKMDAEDFRTWDLQTLFSEIQLHYANSLQNALEAQNTPLEKFSALLLEQPESKKYRPTLYDFLAHQALDFYTTSETSITKPAYKFTLDKPDYLSPANRFIATQITSKDSTSLQLLALKTYQNLIKVHSKDKQPDALTQVNIERLLFVYQNYVSGNKEELLLQTLQTEKNTVLNNEARTLYDYEIASILNNQAGKYQAKNPDTHQFQWKNKEALALCNQALKDFPNSLGAKKCAVLKNDILQKSVTLTLEEYVPIDSPSRILVKYKNFQKLGFTVYQISEKQLKKLNKLYDKKEKQRFITQLPNVTSWSNTLKNEKDYQTHTTEVVLPKLNNSRYVVYASDAENKTYAYSTIQVTDFALVETQTANKTTYQIINRNNGKPIANASVVMTYNTRGSNSKKTKTFTSNSKGSFSLENAVYFNNIYFTISHDQQTARFGTYYIYNYYRNYEKELPVITSFTFTDRSIYRPGQTVFFKTIVLKQENNRSQVIANTPVYATLYDANRQEIGELDLKTNKFGSVAGEFILPNNGLTGEFSIEIDSDEIDFDTYGEVYFSVEEYKRPKFEASFKPVTETFRINDTVSVKGEVLAYSGAKITDAKVVYRVKRNVQYPRWYYWYRPWFNSEPQEITHGEMETDENGAFTIRFKAIPDASVDKKNLPVFTYEITADITDLNGETRSTTTTVKVGYHTLLATIQAPEKINKTEKEHLLQLTTQNLNGEFVPTSGTVKIYKLTAPERVLRKRPWEAPDYQNISEEEFKKLFPHDAYNDEENMLKWKKGTLVFSTPFNTKDSKEITLKNIKKWQSGWYLIELDTQDEFGQEVTDKQHTFLFSPKDKTIADNQLFSVSTDKETYTPGENAIITLGTAAQQLWVTVYVEKEHRIVEKHIMELSNNKKSITIPVKKEDLGGFVIRYSYSYYNHYYAISTSIVVPYPKTQLQIETQTFRDKLQPGAEETWSFTVKGPKGEKVSAELLASMYDASLDQFKTHNWSFNPILQPNYYSQIHPTSNTFGVKNFTVYRNQILLPKYPQQGFDKLNWFGFYFGNQYGGIDRILRGKVSGVTISMVSNDEEPEEEIVAAEITEKKSKKLIKEEALKKDEKLKKDISFKDIIIKKNLQETAFFFPQLKTDKDGNIQFSFTTPEALTRWKLQLLAHTKNLESSVAQFTAVTQKELMVTPNLPRFFRQGDTITIQSKISNISKEDLFGEAKIILLDALTNKDITQEILLGANFEVFKEGVSIFPFTLPAEKNTSVSWKVFIPGNHGAITCKIIAKAGNFSDGEQSTLPVLSNRMLVTETLPMWVRSNQTKTFTLNKLRDNTSTTLKNHKLTLEVTSNPAWYAVQALPYLMEYPYECNEQTFSRYYANALASYIANSNPRIQEVFNQWKNTDALLSNLEKNQELKSLLIQETPWLRDAQSETEQKKRIALLFDLNKMKNELENASRKLLQNQFSNGAWAWFKGGNENRFITQHIITGFGHLKQLQVLQLDDKNNNLELHQAVKKAIKYLDNQFVKEYNDLKKYNPKIDYGKDHLSYSQLHYLYMRSFFPEVKKSKEVERITQYYLSQIQKYWLSRSLYSKGLMTLITHRIGDNKTASSILNSLKENSITSEELGMYWKENTASWYWYQAPIETQALLIEAFSEAGTVFQSESKNLEDIDNLKIWLLKNKQTNRWKTTKATTEAVYALLLQGSDWLNVTDMVDVVIGNQKIAPEKLEATKIEAGTGYFKNSWSNGEITPQMASVTLTKKGKGIAWGALYWQYFEDLDKITPAKTPLQLSKKLFIKKNTDTGEALTEITKDTQVKVGDLVRVRIELKVDRPMEFIHLKDMRASGFEPVNVLSRYKWQDGLGYYESTKDAATNFFFDYLPKGVYVFEYEVRANNAGNFSNGISTIQSMYAPEFSSHSKGVRVTIK